MIHNIQNTNIIDGQKIVFTIIDSFDDKDVTQSYGFCFTHDGKLLIGRRPDGLYGFPGGTRETGESLLQTLTRELDEEINVRIVDYGFIGAQRVEEPSRTHVQVRFACIVECEALTPDPDFGKSWERIAIDPNDFARYFDWGVTGQYFLERAVEWFLSRKT
ncbi:MAG: NUDIX hydrolase [Candidatus Woesearchaeota archaeon]